MQSRLYGPNAMVLIRSLFSLSLSLYLYAYIYIYIYIYGLKAMAWNLVINGPRALVSSSIMHFPKQ